MKLLIRGGSIAAGYGVTRGYADILAERLLPRGVEVIVRSRHRETTFDAVATFPVDIDRFRPDILLFNFGVDDAFQGVYRSEFQENLVQMIRLARLRFGPQVVLATSHTFDDPHDMDAVNIFYRSLSIVASDLDCLLIPVHHHFAGYLEEKGLVSKDLTGPDPRYPNDRGHEVIAEALIEGMDRLIPAPL
jgi:lysophospholipase L1-like esterase